MSLVKPPAGAEGFQSARARIALWFAAADVLVTQAHGHLDLATIRWYGAHAERVLQPGGRLYVFHHWAGVGGYDPDAREWLTQWATRWNPQLAGTHFLIRSRMVAMAISVAALVVRRSLYAYTDEASFRAALDRVVRESSARGAQTTRP